MFEFTAEQKIVQIGKVKVGGQPGEFPTLLIGSIFYSGHKIVKDAKKGLFDRVAAETLIKRQEELSDITGNPSMLDVVIGSEDALKNILDFIEKTTDTPILFDAWPQDIRIKGLKLIEEVGLNSRCVYNSIWFANAKAELDALKNSNIDTALLLTFNPKNHWASGALSILKGTSDQHGLLTIAEKVGIKKVIIDTSATSFIPSIGIAAKAGYLIKEELGFPCGLGPANATTTWRTSNKIWDRKVTKACEAAAQTFPLSLYNDFILYGPIEDQEWIFPTCSTIDAIIKSIFLEGESKKAITSNHPLQKMFPEFVEKIKENTDR